MIDVRDLRLVAALASEGSITKAAELLNSTQPTLSKRLARLEDALGTELFYRAKSGMTPNAVALFLIKDSKPILDRLSGITRQIERLVSSELGDIRVGVGPIVEQLLLTRTLREFARRTGDVGVSVRTEKADLLLQLLETGELDIVAGPFDSTDNEFKAKGIEAISLLQEPTVGVARTGHPIFSQSNTRTFEDFPYAAPALQGAMLSSALTFRANQKRLTCDNYHLVKGLVLETEYVSAGPRSIFAEEIKEGTLREIDGVASIEWQSACLFKKEAFATPLVKLFLETIGEVATSMDNSLARGVS